MMTDAFEVTLRLNDGTPALGARECPRCDKCRHHPNAHAKGSCNVIVERPGNREAKCGCAAVQKVTQPTTKRVA
jgi:hypothetical protein